MTAPALSPEGRADDGGPAFPVAEVPSISQGHPGMSLRDWFAGEALSGVLTNATGLGSVTPKERADVFAKAAALIYEMADAMLKARALGSPA